MGNRASLSGISRLRLGTDEHGVTVLVGFWGCPLRCKYCLNSQCQDRNAKVVNISLIELYNVAKIDIVYNVYTILRCIRPIQINKD